MLYFAYSDVNITTYLLSDAYGNKFDEAFLVANDSDLLGPVRLVRSRFPEKGLKMIVPPYCKHSKELGGSRIAQGANITATS